MIRKLLLLLLLPFVLVASDAGAQCPNGRCPAPARYRIGYVRATTATCYYPAAPTRTVAHRAVPAYGDAYGFGDWLAAVRAGHGLLPLSYDPGLASLAAANSARGFGHNGVFSGYEAVAMGSIGSAEAQWLASPAHLAILLAPGVRTYGIACVGGVTTFTAR